MYKVYALKSEKIDRVYVGMTANLEKRLADHNLGRVFSTKGYRPWRIVFTEDCLDRMSARQREKYWKSGYGKEFLKKL